MDTSSNAASTTTPSVLAKAKAFAKGLKQGIFRKASREEFFEDVTNYSRAKRTAKIVFGPLARVVEREGEVEVRLEKMVPEVLGTGPDFRTALVNATSGFSIKQLEGNAPLVAEMRAIAALEAKSFLTRLRR